MLFFGLVCILAAFAAAAPSPSPTPTKMGKARPVKRGTLTTMIPPTPYPMAYTDAQDCWSWQQQCYNDANNCFASLNYLYFSVCSAWQTRTCNVISSTCVNGLFPASKTATVVANTQYNAPTTPSTSILTPSTTSIVAVVPTTSSTPTTSTTISINTVISTYTFPTPMPTVFANAGDCWMWYAACYADSQQCYDSINYQYQSVCQQLQQSTCAPMATICANGPFGTPTSSTTSTTSISSLRSTPSSSTTSTSTSMSSSSTSSSSSSSTSSSTSISSSSNTSSSTSRTSSSTTLSSMSSTIPSSTSSSASTRTSNSTSSTILSTSPSSSASTNIATTTSSTATQTTNNPYVSGAFTFTPPASVASVFSNSADCWTAWQNCNNNYASCFAQINARFSGPIVNSYQAMCSNYMTQVCNPIQPVCSGDTWPDTLTYSTPSATATNSSGTTFSISITGLTSLTSILTSATGIVSSVPSQISSQLSSVTSDIGSGTSAASLTSSTPSSTTSTSSTSTGPTALPNYGNWTSLGCYTDVGTRALRYFQNIPGSSLTEGLCLDTCSALNYKYAGMEYSGECWCDDYVQGSNGPVSDGCTMACNGDSTELCGGSWRLQMFTNADYAPVTFTVTSITGWNYLGCYTDGLDTRALASSVYYDNAMTVEKCLAYCKNGGYLTAGVQYGTQCYCGAGLPSWSIGSGSLDPVEYGCDMPCGGNSAEYCGGPVRNNVYVQL